MNLPIDIVPGTDPPVFRWLQKVDTPLGRVVQCHEGPLPPSIEGAVAEIIKLYKDHLKLARAPLVPPPESASSAVVGSSSRKRRG